MEKLLEYAGGYESLVELFQDVAWDFWPNDFSCQEDVEIYIEQEWNGETVFKKLCRAYGITYVQYKE